MAENLRPNVMRKTQVYYNNGGGDEQYTPAYGVEILLPHIRHFKDKIIWCPFDTEDSQFVKILRSNGFNIVFSSLNNNQDFLEYEPEQWDVILSNPPYTNKQIFWERCLALGKPFALLLPINILSDSVVNSTIRDERRLSLLIPSRRMRFYNAQTGETGKQPTFKAAYFGVDFFREPIILVDMELK